MKPFSEWPLDGLIAFLLCIFMVILTVYGAGKKSKVTDTIINGKFYLLAPSSYKILLISGLIMAGLVSYGVSQSGHCAGMTVEENIQNVRIGVLLTVIVWSVLLLSAYNIFFVRYSFDSEGISRSSPLSKKYFLWKDFTGVGFSFLGRHLTFSEKQKFYLPSNYQGQDKLLRLIDSYLLNYVCPVSPIYSDEFVSKIENKLVYVFILELTGLMDERVLEGFSGKIRSVGQNGILVLKEDGSLLTMKANFRSLLPAEDYRDEEMQLYNLPVPENIDVELVAIYYKTEGLKYDHQ